MINELGNIFLSISASLSFCMFALIFFKNTISISSRFIFFAGTFPTLLLYLLRLLFLFLLMPF